jgi:Carboxypeptidase regulatory-like domain/TonB dependent receptor
MDRMFCRRGSAFLFVASLLLVHSSVYADTNATLSGLITDPQGRAVTDTTIVLTNVNTGITYQTKTNGEGIYRLNGLLPGIYRANVSKDGFKSIVKADIELHVQDQVSINFALQLGSIMETITVEAGAPLVNTQDATVSTVVDRQLAENLPLNGRSFQSLIQLTPGVVLTANNGVDTGQFSINGQRANANYWMVDGVSANIGISASPTPGSGLAGTLGSTSVLGGTNSLVSVDALQEFRIQTSTYAPEFGRTPGGQISIVTRSGTNQFHGSAFDYLRNDVLDANDWFNGFTNNPPLPKAEERQNDFGGTFGGPIIKGKTFFFFSYEGLRLRLPHTALTFVPDASFTPGTTNSRQNAIAALQPYLNAFPLPSPTSPEVLCDPTTDPTCPPSGARGYAALNASYSNPATLDADSLRVDHKINDKLNLFGRYNYSPTVLTVRGSSAPLSTVSPTTTNTQTATVGALWAISPVITNDFRFNYSNTDASLSNRLDNFGGAVPLQTLPFPSPFTAQNASFNFQVLSLGLNSALLAGASVHNQQRQVNIVDSVSLQKSSHGLKFGVDYRRLSPHFGPAAYSQNAYFKNIPSAEAGTPNYSVGADDFSSLPVTFLFRNLGVFAQDTWHVVPRLTMTYGLRWDVDFVPSSLSGPDFSAVTGFNLSDLSKLALAPAGTPPYKTKWGNLAPRIGLAYQVSQSPRWQTVLRGGFGVFYDLASSEAGNNINPFAYPFGSFAILSGNFPFADAAPAPIVPPTPSNPGVVDAFDPNLGLPHTLQWNVAVEQALGTQQSMTVSYVGAAGRRLIQTAGVSLSTNPDLLFATLLTNAGTSDYNALQLQLQRRLSRGLQALASYSWSHSLDTASAGSFANSSNALLALNPHVNRGASDFDVRNAFSMALTYDVPAPKGNVFAKAILRGWSTENIIQVRSAPPVDVYTTVFGQLSNGFTTNVRPDVVAGVPLYLYGPQYPGGKAFNNTPGAVAGGCPDGSPSIGPFCSPPVDPAAGFPTRQGNLPRNALRGFDVAQWDFAVHREFGIHESLKLQFRAEMFNVLNRPNFGPPDGNLVDSQFGRSTQMLGQSLNGQFGTGSGGFDPLYQLGGPRSIQFGLKLSF